MFEDRLLESEKTMKILWITLESILPSNTGGRIGVFKRLEQISKNDEIYLFYPYDNESELDCVKELEKYCRKVSPYNRKKNRKHSLFNIWRYPFTVSSREIPEMKKDILKCVKEYNIDLINIDFPHMCIDICGMDINVPVVLNEHNIEWKVYRTIAKSHKSILKKAAYFIDSYRLKLYEKKLFEKINFSKVTFVSINDMNYMLNQGIIGKSKAALIPVGADIHKCADISHEGKNIVFVGKMSYGPNIEGVKWFVDEIFPNIKEKIPDAIFYIVGKEPTEEVKKLQSESIIVTGMVENVEVYYKLADLVVLPLKNGGGVKVKLLEAISYKKPIVSTSTGAEGTYYAQNLLPVTNDPNAFAEYCVEYIVDKSLYPMWEVYDYFVLNYTWEGIGKKYRKIMQEVLNEQKSKKL